MRRKFLNIQAGCRRTALTALFAVLTSTGVWASGSEYASGAPENVPETKMCVVIHEAHDVTTAFDLEEKPVVSFTDTDVQLVCGTVTVLYPLDNYLKMTIEEVGIETDVKSLFDEAFKITGNAISAKGCSQLSLFSVDGKCLLSEKPDAEGTCTLSTSTLHAGVYIVVVGNKSFKIYKK